MDVHNLHLDFELFLCKIFIFCSLVSNANNDCKVGYALFCP